MGSNSVNAKEIYSMYYIEIGTALIEEETIYYYQIFYLVGRKVVPKNISEILTPRALVYWFMDDGTRCHFSSYLSCTDCFTREDMNILIEEVKTAPRCKEKLNLVLLKCRFLGPTG